MWQDSLKALQISWERGTHPQHPKGLLWRGQACASDCLCSLTFTRAKLWGHISISASSLVPSRPLFFFVWGSLLVWLFLIEEPVQNHLPGSCCPHSCPGTAPCSCLGGFPALEPRSSWDGAGPQCCSRPAEPPAPHGHRPSAEPCLQSLKHPFMCCTNPYKKISFNEEWYTYELSRVIIRAN